MIISAEHGTLYAMERKQGFSSVGIIYSVFVQEQYRRQGIGTQLMREAVSEIATRPLYLYACELNGTPKNVLHRFYKRFGFRKMTKEELRDLDPYLKLYRVDMVLDK